MDYLHLSLRPRNPSWIWIRYIQYATIGTPLCHPQNWLCRCDALFRSRHLALISPLDHINGDNARLSRNPPDTQNSRWLQGLFPPTANKTFAKLRRTQFFARPTIRAAFSTFSWLHFVTSLTSSPMRLAAQKQTKYSMLQIKPLCKDISTSTSWTFSFKYPTTISEGITHLARKQLNVNTHTYVTTYPR